MIIGFIITQAVINSEVEAKHYYVCSGYTANYRGSANSKDNGVTKTIYIDSDFTGRYMSGGKFIKDKNQNDLKGGLFQVRVIEVWDWDVATKYHPKQQIVRKDYHYFRVINDKPYCIFDDEMVGNILENDIKSKIVPSLEADGLHCIDYRWIGTCVDELVLSEDNASSDSYLLRIYKEARKIYEMENNY